MSDTTARCEIPTVWGPARVTEQRPRTGRSSLTVEYPPTMPQASQRMFEEMLGAWMQENLPGATWTAL